MTDTGNLKERQNEPSIAQIEAAKVAINRLFYQADTRYFDAYSWDRLYREMAVAALSAALAVGEVR